MLLIQILPDGTAGEIEIVQSSGYERLDRAAAEADITRALSLNATDAEVLYYSAGVRALAGDSERALASLEQALKNGYSAAVAAKDFDLSSIRTMPRFRELVGAR